MIGIPALFNTHTHSTENSFTPTGTYTNCFEPCFFQYYQGHFSYSGHLKLTSCFSGFAGVYSIVMSHNMFNHSPVDLQLNPFHLFTTTNNTAVNIFVHMSFCIFVFSQVSFQRSLLSCFILHSLIISEISVFSSVGWHFAFLLCISCLHTLMPIVRLNSPAFHFYRPSISATTNSNLPLHQPRVESTFLIPSLALTGPW